MNNILFPFKQMQSPTFWHHPYFDSTFKNRIEASELNYQYSISIQMQDIDRLCIKQSLCRCASAAWAEGGGHHEAPGEGKGDLACRLESQGILQVWSEQLFSLLPPRLLPYVHRTFMQGTRLFHGTSSPSPFWKHLKATCRSAYLILISSLKIAHTMYAAR